MTFVAPAFAFFAYQSSTPSWSFESSALRALHRTGRVYQDDQTLCDPSTGAAFPTLAPRLTTRAASSAA